MKKFTYSNPKLALEILSDLNDRIITSEKERFNLVKKKKEKKVTRMSN